MFVISPSHKCDGNEFGHLAFLFITVGLSQHKRDGDEVGHLVFYSLPLASTNGWVKTFKWL